MNLSPTPFHDLNAVLQELVNSMRAALEDNFIGAYLQGSFATGGYDQHSDVDFIAITEQELSEDQVAALLNMHPRVHALPSPWAQHLEGSYFTRKMFMDYRYRGQKVWYLDNGATQMIRSHHCNTIVVRWTVQKYGVRLAGPAAHELVEPIPVAMLRQEIREVMVNWGQEIFDDPDFYRNSFYQGFIVLSYCRMLHSLAAGDLYSKRAGAEWAKTNLDAGWRSLIDRAWDTRPDPAASVRRPPDPQDFTDTLRFVRYCMSKSQA